MTVQDAAERGRLTRARIQFALPRIEIIALAFVVAPLTALAIALAQPTDFDYWWHRQTGQHIVENLTVPTADPFAFTTEDKTWVDHEWLAQVLMFATQGLFGYLGLFLFMFGLGLGAWLLIYKLLRSEQLGRAQALALSMAPLVFGAAHWRARPAMFTIFFLALLISELFASRRGERAKLWHFVPLLALWANLHGGYVIGLVVIGLFAFAQCVDRRQAAGAGWKHATVVLAAAFVATGLNPYTYRIWLYPLTYFVGDNASLQLVDEWQSANFHEQRSLPFAGLLLLAMLIGASGRRFDAWRAGLLIIFGAITLQSMRHQPLFAIIWAPIIGVSLAERWSWWKKERLLSPGVPSVNYALLLGAVAALIMVVAASPRGLPLWNAPSEGGMPYPVAGAAYIEREHKGARIFNEYIWGGYLIDRLYPSSQVYIDGRADLHGSLLIEYRAIMRGSDWEEAFARHRVEVVLVRPGTALARALVSAGWESGYEDTHQIVLIPPPSDSSELPRGDRRS